MAILVYSSGISGGSVDAIVSASRYVKYAIGMRLTKQPLYWRLENEKRKYMHAMPVLDESDTYGIRYGWRGVHMPDGVKDLQDTREKRSGIHIAANKFIFRRWATENGVSVPLTWSGKADEPVELPLPILGRPSKHRKGKEYHIYENEEQYRASEDDVENGVGYYSQLLPKTAEYRIFVFESYVWTVAQKNPAKGVGEYDPWNYALGNASFKLLRYNDWPRAACTLARIASHRLGLLWGGVDVILVDKTPYIVEINNAPGIDGRLKRAYIGTLVDDLISRWQADKTVGSVDPENADRLRHPALKGK